MDVGVSGIPATTETVVELTELTEVLCSDPSLSVNIQTFPGLRVGSGEVSKRGKCRNSGATNLLSKFSSSHSQGRRNKKWRTSGGWEKCRSCRNI